MSSSTNTLSLLRAISTRSSPVLRLAAGRRWQSTLHTNKCNPHIYVFPDERTLSNQLLTLLPSSPPNPNLALGSTTQMPPTPDSLRANPRFLSILHEVLRDHAHEDQLVIGSASAYASSGGSSLGSGGAFFPNQPPRRRKKTTEYGGGGGGAGGDGAGGASSQGGAGGAGRGGYVHVYDVRHPPDFGRIPDPEDIFGSVEVDSDGNFVDGNGRYQESGTYRLITRDGILGLTDFLREKLVARLEQEVKKSE